MSYYAFIFFGLIMHISKNEDGPIDHSALIWDDDHKRKIAFGEHDTEDLKNAPTIEIRELQPAPAKPEPSFTTYVPNVKKIMGGSLESRARNATSSDATFFRHVGGTFYGGFLYDKRARYTRTRLMGTKIIREVVRDEYVACCTAVIVETDKALKLEAGEIKRDLVPDSFVVIGNIDNHDPANHDSRNNPHFRKYSRLTGGSNTAIVIDEHAPASPLAVALPKMIEPWIIDLITKGIGKRTSIHSECGNSAWP